ncbi:hypothetical protein B0H17DRAFT_1333213 [Mycena rosella]|uniref:Proteophosphoglycan 5 n=1 Tax=Mycena rosella TaxID=1033263 RepID=A0AAD7D9P9_MYCRO|nr:hypothetical protein B0H17DRAFT_1333213 [Mycena rosella]
MMKMDPKIASKSRHHLLRSRSRSFGSPPSQIEELEVCEKPNNPPSRRVASIRKVSDTPKVFLPVILLAIFALVIWRAASIELPTAAEHHTGVSNPNQKKIQSLPDETVSSNPHKVPLVDRSILQRLADLEIYPDPEERPYFATSHDRPPIVTRIPEAKKPLVPPLPPPDICSPEACRFLLPLRISEQESKARIHFMEILQLAQKLDRILVLPNVGKSRIGACFKSDFDMYYDLERLTGDLDTPSANHTRTVKLDLFRRWIDAETPTAQMVFLATKEDARPGADLLTFSNNDVSVRLVANDSTMDLPACFAKVDALRLDAHAPLHIHLKPNAHRRPIDASILDALSRSEIQAASSLYADPAVLVLTWDLRHPIFAPIPARPRLHYAPQLHALATALAPAAPFAMVHWRMESVPPAVLPQCAHALIDALARLPGGLRTVWFASDYPHAVHRSARPGTDFGAAPAGDTRKSGTFRDVGPLHAEAVGIFGDAFAEGGELEGWEIAELTDTRLAALDGTWESEVLEDVGVHAIVDKIIGTQATMFVSGAPGCARKSSFTRQVLEERQEALARGNNELLTVQNMVEFFG